MVINKEIYVAEYGLNLHFSSQTAECVPTYKLSVKKVFNEINHSSGHTNLTVIGIPRAKKMYKGIF